MQGAQSESPMGSIVSTIFFAEVAMMERKISTLRGLAIDYGGGRCRSSRQHPQGARHRLWWWPLPELPTASPGGSPSTSSSTTVVAAAGTPGSTPKGLAIDVFIDYGGGRCRSSRQHPQRTRNQHLAKNLVPVTSFFLVTPTRGPLRPTLLRQARQSFAEKYF
jgi:hypothetical protein